jgi:hypothetical protein
MISSWWPERKLLQQKRPVAGRFFTIFEDNDDVFQDAPQPSNSYERALANPLITRDMLNTMMAREEQELHELMQMVTNYQNRVRTHVAAYRLLLTMIEDAGFNLGDRVSPILENPQGEPMNADRTAVHIRWRLRGLEVDLAEAEEADARLRNRLVRLSLFAESLGQNFDFDI